MSAGGAPDLGATALAVAGALVLLAGLAHWWLRGRDAGVEGAIRLVATRSLGGKRLVAVVEVEGERFLLGMTDDTVTRLARLAPGTPPARLRAVTGGGVGV